MNEHLRNIQAALHGLGYEAGPVDGQWGAKTKIALQQLVLDGGPAPERPVAPGGTIYQGHTPVREIIVHCAATATGWMEGRSLEDKIREITAWHRKRGFATIGYHWVIDRDGRVLPGRKETEIGAHVEGHNMGTIGISLIGGATSKETDKFAKNYTPAQDAALRKLIGEIKGRTQITKISGHNQYASKACPGFYVPQWLAEK